MGAGSGPVVDIPMHRILRALITKLQKLFSKNHLYDNTLRIFFYLRRSIKKLYQGYELILAEELHNAIKKLSDLKQVQKFIDFFVTLSYALHVLLFLLQKLGNFAWKFLIKPF